LIQNSAEDQSGVAGLFCVSSFFVEFEFLLTDFLRAIDIV